MRGLRHRASRSLTQQRHAELGCVAAVVEERVIVWRPSSRNARLWLDPVRRYSSPAGAGAAAQHEKESAERWIN